MEDDDLPRMRQDAAAGLSGESLDSYSQDELTARIRLLEEEISRVRAHYRQADDNRRKADALFKPRETD